MLVHPLAPLDIADGKDGSGELDVAERGDELERGVADGFGGDAGGADLKKIGSDVAIGGDSVEGIGQAFALVVFGDLAVALSHLG